MNMDYYKRYEPLFGSWKIVRLLGEGSYGKVFEIERQDIKKTYKAALKAITIPANESELNEIMLEGMDEAAAKEYFRSVVEDVINEFDLMAQMKGNSNIVSYEDHAIIEHEDGIGWDILIRMELLTPLNKHYKQNGMSKTDVIRLGIDMCRALEVCKKNDIIHRDIKPENIFVSSNGDYKLGDFGVAKSMENSHNSFSKKGTGFYMAPEVYKGRKYDRLVDIYSVGLVMYRYLNNNVLPFLPQSAEAVTYRKKEEALERRMSGEPLPSPVVIDDALFSVIRRACAYYPQDRYTNPSDMRRELERILDREESIDEFSDDGSYYVDNDVVSEEEPQTDNQPSKGKSKKLVAIILALAAVVVAVVAVIYFTRNKDDQAPNTQAEQPATAANAGVTTEMSENGTSSLPESVTETTTEITTQPNTLYEEIYFSPFNYSEGKTSRGVYTNQWADVRIPVKSGYGTTSRFNINGMKCVFRIADRRDSLAYIYDNKGDSLSALIDTSGYITQFTLEQYLNDEVKIRTDEMKKAGYSVNPDVVVSHTVINEFNYNAFVLELTDGDGNDFYSGYYYRRIGDYMFVIKTFSDSSYTEKELISAVKAY